MLDTHFIYNFPFHLVRWETGISSQAQEIIPIKQVHDIEP
jgi:hypothetical protein